MNSFDFLHDNLVSLKNNHLFRDFKTVTSSQGPFVEINGCSLLCLCSNNYLGLADRSELKDSAIEAIKKYGTGAGASRLLSGHMASHQKLEQKLAHFEKTEGSIVFSTGFMANLGVIHALLDHSDLVIADRLNHASLIDACRMSKATFRVYPHCDMHSLETILKKGKTYQKRLIVTDTVFSMDGDLAPLQEIIELAKKYQAMVMIDEAHGTGVLGANGRGAAEALGVEDNIDIKMGTLSKALGSLGGFVAGDNSLIAWLRNKARSFIYTTALPPAICESAGTALDLVTSEPRLRDKLHEHSLLVRNILGLSIPKIVTPIIPIMIGDTEKAVRLSSYLFEQGLFAPPIRPPTVPKGTSRIRISLMADHTEDQLRDACKTIKRGMKLFSI